VDVEATQIGKVFEPDLGIVGDAKLALADLLAVARDMTPKRKPGPWVERVAALRRVLRRRTDFDAVPIKPHRVFREIDEAFDRDTIFVTAIGLYQIFSGQFQKIYKPRHYLVCGQAGPLGWEVSACTGVKLAKPDQLVVGVVGDYSFQFMMEEVAVAAQYKVPFVLVMLNNVNLGLIRQAELRYDMEYAIDLAYDAGDGDEKGIDHVKIMEAMGCHGRRVERPEEIREAFDWAGRTAREKRVPVLVEIMTERRANAAMGTSIDNIREFEPMEQHEAIEHGVMANAG